MIAQQTQTQTSLFEDILNNYSTLQRCLMFTFALIVIGTVMFAEKANIASFFFSNLPMGLGLTSNFVAPLTVIGILALSSAAYFGIISTIKMKPLLSAEENNATFLSELRVTLVFGACFGLLTAILCSLIFVIAEPHLPQSFLVYHQIFSSLDIPLILLTAVLLSSIYLGLFMLPLSLLITRLSANDNKLSQFNLTTRAIGLSSLVVSLFVALVIMAVTSTFSINVIIFCVIVTVISSATLGLLYWFVGLEASVIANVVYCLIVSYLAHIFL
ncbi:hypothetical protein HWV00_07925 [Moritella sp. 24]|nr:hypothetical protein HWV00_07925 [Moritella sp. 24]